MPRGPIRVLVLTSLLVAVAFLIFGSHSSTVTERKLSYVFPSSDKWHEGLSRVTSSDKWKLWNSKNKPQPESQLQTQRIPMTEERLQTNRPGGDREQKDAMKVAQAEGVLDNSIALEGIKHNGVDRTGRVKTNKKPLEEPHEPEMDRETTEGHQINNQLMAEEHNQMMGQAPDADFGDEILTADEAPTRQAKWQAAPEEAEEPPAPAVPAKEYSKTLVLGKPGDMDTDWMVDKLKGWKRVVYDIPTSSSNQPGTKQIAQRGGAALAFLTYITENYNALTDITLFVSTLPLHKTPKNKLFDGEEDWKANLTVLAPRLQTMNYSYIEQRGYTSLRCEEKPGCSFDTLIKPSATWVFAQPWHHEIFPVWRALFPTNDHVPDTISAPMVAQFAVTREQVHKRSLAAYSAMRSWVADSRTDEGMLQRVMTSLWHVIFSHPPVDCPAQLQCYCELYGKCNLGTDKEKAAAKAAKAAEEEQASKLGAGGSDLRALEAELAGIKDALA